LFGVAEGVLSLIALYCHPVFLPILSRLGKQSLFIGEIILALVYAYSLRMNVIVPAVALLYGLRVGVSVLAALNVNSLGIHAAILAAFGVQELSVGASELSIPCAYGFPIVAAILTVVVTTALQPGEFARGTFLE
jgi:hypothetical protein